VIIDIHTHLAPGAEAQEEEALTQACRRHGMALAFVSCLGTWEACPPTAAVRAANDRARAAVANDPGRLRWMAYLNPQNGDWREELERCRAAGALGIKLWIALKGAAGSLENTAEVLARAARCGLPVLVHTFSRTDANLPGEINIAEFAALARRVPGATLIGAHAGGNWREAARTLRDGPSNALVDVSGGYPEQGMVETLVASLGSQRVLFGSDALGRSVPSQLAKVLLAGVSAADREAILGQNAVRVFGLRDLPVEPAAPAPGPAHLTGMDEITDHFCFCGRGPYWEQDGGTPAQLDNLLADHGIAAAYVGNLGSVFASGPLPAANAAFARTCAGLARVRPLATLDPRDPDWRRALQAVAHPLAGGIVHPYLHAWRLDDPQWGDFFAACAERGVPLWINCALSDHRVRHPALRARPVPTEEVDAFAAIAPASRYVIQGASPDMVRAVLTRQPAAQAQFHCEISRLTDLDSHLANVLKQHGPSSLVIGSEFPFRHLEEVRFAARRV
jgi:uncharacterized protein